MGASFQIGRSALAAYQASIAVTGQNIANVGNPDYTRQSGRLTALYGGSTPDGIAAGAGVRLTALERHIDEAVEARLRQSLGVRSGAETTYLALSQVEGLYNELTGTDLSTQLGEFFASFATMQTTPTDMTARSLILSAADQIIRTLQRQRSGLIRQISDLNESVVQATERANQIAQEIGRLNEQIVAEEARGLTVSGALRDRRDALLRDLAGYLAIQVRPQANGSINVYAGSEPLVEFDRVRGLTTQLVVENGFEIAGVRFAADGGSVALREGKLAAIVEARDVHIAGQLEQLDRLARGLIYEVNRVHSTGRGLVGYTAISGSYAVLDPDAALNSAPAGLPFPVQNGTFIVHVRDRASGQEITRQIEVDLDGFNNDDTSLASLAAALSGVPGLTASVTGDNRLQIRVAAGSEVWFSEDGSGALAALGVGTFFEGTTAGSIAVNPAVRQDVRLISSSLSGALNDGTIAGRLAGIGEQSSALLANQSIRDFQAQIVNRLAVDAAAARTSYEAADAVYSALVAQRQAVSGVSLDEEAINLAKFERSFQGAARFISVVDELTNEILALVA